jgi:predicted permease
MALPRQSFVGGLGRDLIHAARTLTKARAFTFVSVVSLGIGIGTFVAVTVFFGVITGTPPGIQTDGLVELLIRPQGQLRTQTGETALDHWAYQDFADVREADTGLTTAAWSIGQSVFRLSDGGGGVYVSTLYASPSYFKVMGVTLARGRGFDDRDATELPEVIVSDTFWKDRLAADPDVIGRRLIINGTEHVVVGLTPENFKRHLAPEESPRLGLWMPLRQHPRMSGAASVRFDRNVDWLRVHGRLAPGVSIEQANAAVSSVMSGLAARFPATNQFKGASVEPYYPMGARMRDIGAFVHATLYGAVSFVLLVVCLNISGMVLVRSAKRERELSLRVALGASRRRLMQYLLAESLLLASAGGVLGAAVIFGAPALVAWWFAAPLPAEFRPSWTMVATCVGLCLATSLAFGLLPALRFSRPSVVSSLKEDAAGGGRRVGRVHRLTAAVQAGLAVPFLVICGLKLDSVHKTATSPLGFEPQALFAAPLDLSRPGSEADPSFFLRTAQERLAEANGVSSVTASDGLPLDFRARTVRVTREDQPTVVRAHSTRVAPGYLKTLDITLLRGRDISAEDRAGSELVTVISEPLAARLFAGTEPIGQRLVFAFDDNTERRYTIIGVTADVVTSQMGTTRPQLFVPLAQHPSSRLMLIARSSAPAAAMTTAFANAMADIEPDAVRSSMITGDDLVRDSMRDLLSHSTVAGVVAGVTLALTALGVFGVIGFMVATRTREIGVRIALGASRSRVVGTVLVDAIRLIVPGLVLGLGIAVVLVRTSDITWYSPGGVEPAVYAIAAGIASLVALLAGLPSARHAAAIDPIVAMRSE